LQEATNGEGPDVIIEMLANVNLDTDMQLINKNGYIVVSATEQSTIKNVQNKRSQMRACLCG